MDARVRGADHVNWLGALPSLVDRVVFRIMREEPTRDAEFMAGNFDICCCRR